MKIYRYAGLMAGVVLLASMVMACAGPKAHYSSAATTGSDSMHRTGQVTQMVEALYLKSKDLKTIYLDLRAVAQAHAFLPDDGQLNYVQKSTHFVEKAFTTAHHQWELFSIMQDIKPSMVIDYYTLRHRGLNDASHQTKYDRRFLEIYQPFITSRDAQKEIRRALAAIEEIQTLYGQLMDAIAPLVRHKRPTSI